LNVIDRLPRDSEYFEAVCADEDLARQHAKQEQLDARGEPVQRKPVQRMRDWSASVELLTMILNRLAELTQAVAALGGAKPRQIEPAPMPVTALERVRNRSRHEKHKALTARVLRRPPQ
jgi:hypothetical protein